ncbi:LacI family DNA-binding transcriptional regulator [Sphingobacterium suaedae]|uniref:LacI family DNA-binding transcriptional regulator n=1 Tax=Sphingobacterium suaedae TaxID=1686402 RepID=A0ABW5KN97_9SPHI
MSISEIAKHLKVSKSTVSLVINGKAEQGRISKASAKRILDYIDEIGYKPNALAKSLATGKSRTIGLIVENIGDSFFGPIALYIEEYLRKYEYQVLYSSTLGKNDIASEVVQTMMDKHVDGIILAPTDKQEFDVQRIIKQNIPLVVFDRKIPEIDTNYVGTDNYQASRNAVEYLIDQGYKHIGLITIPSGQPQMLDRFQGYSDAIEQKKLKPYVLRTSFIEKDDRPAVVIGKWLQDNPQVDALYFSTNYVCVAGLKAIKNLKNKRSVGIMAFDDHEIFELVEPQVSCVRQPLEKIAEQVVGMLVRQLKDKGAPLEEKIIPAELIVRKNQK